MNVLVFLENRGDLLAKGSLGLLAKAAALAGDDGGVGALLAGGPGTKGLVAEAGAFGARRVYLAEHDSLDPPLAQPRVDILEEVVRSNHYDTVLFANSVMAADIAAGLAERLGAGLNWDLIDLVVREDQLVGKQLALGDSVLADVGWRSPVRLALFRTGTLEPILVSPDQRDPHVSAVPLRLRPHSTAARVVEERPTSDVGPALEDADVVVAGGMGLGGPEHFKLAEDLAAALGGVVGASRAAVYAGWYPHSAQVGQTGKTVTPKLYIALGISGAVQHKVGMQSSKVIVAVNKDPNAPVFEFSDLAVIGDLHAIVPQLVELLERRGVVLIVRAADYPPQFDPSQFVIRPTDPADTRIEVGVLVVGAGPAGLACAIRFGQLLEDDPKTAERLGEVPLAVIEKGKQPGSQLLSGVIINPVSLRRLFGDGLRIEDLPTYGPVDKEAVYVLSRRNALRIPVPPTMRNHGNVVASLSQVGRWMAGRAEDAGAIILPGTTGHRLLATDGTVVGVRTGDKGRGFDGGELSNFEPGVDMVARVTVLADGTHGHLTGLAVDHFQLHPRHPQVWELGVKEVWRVARPLDRVIHTMGWPLRPAARYREFGGSFIYPMGDDMISIGMVVGLDYRDVELSAHDLLQQLKTHPMIAEILEGGERLEWGAKTIPGGGFYSLPARLHAPGVLFCGDGAGMVNVPTLKGVHYAIESGRLAAEAAFAAVKASEGDRVPTAALASYDDAIAASFIWRDLHQVRDLRLVFGRGFYLGSALAGLMTLTRGRISLGAMEAEADANQPLLRTGRARDYPSPDGKLTFDKLSSVFASGNRSRDDQPNHLRVAERVPEELATMWAHMCPAQVYEVGARDANDLVEVKVTPSNCVQCGAIAAKGGCLTPPEGGSGPEYTLA